MQFGLCTGFAAEPLFSVDETHEEKAAALGFSYIEYPLMTVTALPEEDFQTLLDRRAKAKLASVALCNLFPASVPVTGEKRDEAKIRAYLDGAFPSASRLGAEKLIFGSAGARRLGTYPRKKADEEFLQTLAILNGYCEKYRMDVLIEAIRIGEADYINTLAEAAAFVNAARERGLGHIGLMADLFHMEENGEPLSSLTEHFTLLSHIHIAGHDRSPALTGYVRKGLALLAEAGYDGSVSFESRMPEAGSLREAAAACGRSL